MARSRETKIELTAYDDLFQTDESREEAKLSKIRNIPISEIDEFPDHPFKVLMDEDMEQLVESIKRNGVMTPATVRLKEDGRYELISGHRRKKACELAGLETLKCEVKELTRDEAIIVMVESNLQRSVILPSEKAFAYKMRLEAMKRQGERSDLTSSPMGTKLRSDAELAEKVGESRNQIQRYIRLTELVPEILQMVDSHPIQKAYGANSYTKNGRELVHKKLEGIDMAVLHDLMRNPIEGESIEFNDNRLSLYSAQKGKCAVTGNQMDADDVVCIRKTPKEQGGTDKYSNLLLVCRNIQKLLYIKNPDTFIAEMEKLNLDLKRTEKLLKLRSLTFVESC